VSYPPLKARFAKLEYQHVIVSKKKASKQIGLSSIHGAPPNPTILHSLLPILHPR
jgi:hypothetical protein